MICSVELVLCFPAQVNICLLSTYATCFKAQVGFKMVSKACIDKAIINGCVHVWLCALRGNNDDMADFSQFFSLCFIFLYSSSILFSILRARDDTHLHLLVVSLKKGDSASYTDLTII